MTRFIYDRDSLLSFLGSITPIQECQFFLRIDPQESAPYALDIFDQANFNYVKGVSGLNAVLVTEFSIPDLGVKFVPDSAMMGITVPQATFNSFSIGFLVKSDSASIQVSPIHTYYEGMFRNGLLREGFNKPNVSMWVKTPFPLGNARELASKAAATVTTAVAAQVVVKRIEEFYSLTSPICLFEAVGCKFSQPIPSMNQKSTEFSVFRTQVSFNEFIYGHGI